MILTNDKFKEIIYGTLNITEKDGYLFLDRLTDFQHELTKEFVGSMVNSSITIEFESEADSFAFSYKKISLNTAFDTIDYYVDNVMTEIIPYKSISDEGTLTFNIPKGFHHIAVYLPSDGAIDVKDFLINGSYKRIKKGKRVLFIGDSITQGYGPYLTSSSFVNVIMREMNYNVLNQGVGGYYYSPEFLVPLQNNNFDLVVIAMGTNQHQENNRFDKTEAFFKKYNELYSDKKTLVITPLWRGDEWSNFELLKDYGAYILKLCEKYPNIKAVNGFDMVPKDDDCYCDRLHPNVKGSKIYAENIIKIIKENDWGK